MTARPGQPCLIPGAEVRDPDREMDLSMGPAVKSQGNGGAAVEGVHQMVDEHDSALKG
jgi:hypothetical protein